MEPNRFHEQSEDADSHLLAGRHQEFSHGWDGGQFTQTICQDMAAVLDGEAGGDPRTRMVDAVDLLSAILLWLSDSTTPRALASKSYALLLAVRPDLLDSPSQSKIARRMRVSKAYISKRVTEVYDMANGIFSHGINCQSKSIRDMRRECAARQHRKR